MEEKGIRSGEHCSMSHTPRTSYFAVGKREFWEAFISQSPIIVLLCVASNSRLANAV